MLLLGLFYFRECAGIGREGYCLLTVRDRKGNSIARFIIFQ